MGICEQIDAGQVPLGGDDGLLKGMLKAALERGLEVELTDMSATSAATRRRRRFRIRVTASARRRSPARSAMSSWWCRGTARQLHPAADAEGVAPARRPRW